MKATDTLLSTIIIGVTLIIMTRCSQSEDLIDAGAQALNAATNNDKELVLTASEQIALSVKQKGSYNISEKEAKKNQRVVEIKEIQGESRKSKSSLIEEEQEKREKPILRSYIRKRQRNGILPIIGR